MFFMRCWLCFWCLAGCPLAAPVRQARALIVPPVLARTAGSAPGFERGLGAFDAALRRPHPGESRYDSIDRRGGEVVAHALAWLTQPRRGPFFLWVHLYDAHDPYDP